jgi:hypothetical protein
VADRRLPLLIQRDGGRAADDAVIVLGLLDLAAAGVWSLRRAGLRRRWRMERLGAPPADDRALTALDVGLRGAPTEDGAVPVMALGWWMRHWGIGATRVRDAAREDLAAQRFAPRDELPPRPPRDADDVEVALGGFPATGDERDFARRVLKARDTPGGIVGPSHNGDNRGAAVQYGIGAGL